MQYTSDDALAVAENKILMLYILEKVKKDIAYKVYLELVTTLTEINYFVFHETLEELIEEGIEIQLEPGEIIRDKKLIKVPKPRKNEKIRYIDGDKTFDEVLKEGQESEWDKSLEDKEEKIITYRLSKLGEDSLKVAINMIPGISKLKIDTEFKKHYKLIKQDFSVSADYLPEKNKVICKAGEDDINIIRVELMINSVEQAKKIVRNWKQKADTLYLDIINILSKTEEDELEKSNMTIDLYEEMVSERKEEESKRKREEQ